MTNKIPKIFLLTYLLLATCLIAGTYRERFTETYRFERGGELLLENSNGSVSIESWDKNQVRIEAEKVVKARSRRDAEELMRRIRIDVKEGNDYLEIKTRYPRQSSGFWRSLVGDHAHVSVSYRLMVPTESNLDIVTVNGKIDINEVSGAIQVKSTNGGIHVYEAKGRVDAKTTNGGIEVELLDFSHDADMSFRTTNGSIKVYFPHNLQADIDAKTTNGSVRTDFPIQVRGTLSRRRLKGTINGGGGRVVLHTTNGGIKILER